MDLNLVFGRTGLKEENDGIHSVGVLVLLTKYNSPIGPTDKIG
jgi:hypothetical protein